jgi:hypothetical protein
MGKAQAIKINISFHYTLLTNQKSLAVKYQME